MNLHELPLKNENYKCMQASSPLKQLILMKRLHIYLLTGVLSLLGLRLAAQEVTLSGVVVDKNDQNDHLAGVTVSVVKLADGKTPPPRIFRTTDAKGAFSIRVPVNATIRFTYVGFESYTMKAAAAQSDLKIYLAEKLNLLEDAIVVGYTNKNKKNNVTAAVTISAKDLVATPVASVMDLMQGRVAGLNVQLNNGTPGMAGTYTIRGISDISVNGEGEDMFLNSSNPLFVVDGIPQEDVGDFNSAGLLSGSGISPISMIPVEDIADIQVLKDAAATAQYGSRGAYGVIIINTKRGNSPKPVVSYSNSVKFSAPPRLRDVMVGMTERNSRIYQLMTNDTSVYHGYYDMHENPILSDSLNAYYNNNTDWQRVFYRTTYSQNHNVNFSGGDPLFSYKVNGNYYQENGIIKNTGFERYGVGMLMEYAPTDKFKMTAKASATFGLSNKGSGNNLGQSGVASGANASSLLPPPSLYTTTNDVLSALSVDNQATSIAYDASLQTTYRLPYNITWNNVFGYTYRTEEQEIFTPGILIQNRAENGAQVESNSTNSYNVYLRSSANYATQVNIFTLGLTLGAELSMSDKIGNGIRLGGLPNGILGPIGQNPLLSYGSTVLNDENNTISFTIAPSFAIGSLDKKVTEKYIFNPTIRPEVNSAYGSKMKFTLNPGFGVKWNFYLEPFMQKLDFLSYGAIRTSWGLTTRYQADIYDVWGSYLVNAAGNTYNGASYIPIDFSSMPNADLKPVLSTMWNAGLDLFFLDNRVTFTGDAYYKQIDNQINTIDLADHNRFDNIKSTDVSLVNYGLELALGLRPLSTQSPFNLNFNFTLAINKDVITKLPNESRQIISSDSRVVNKLGSNALSNYLYVYKGVYAHDEDVPVDPSTGRRLRMGGESSESEQAYFRAGDPIWVDINGDYIIDEKDLTIVGNSQPRMTGGFNLNMQYKSLSINTNCSFTLRRDIVNAALAQRFGFFNNPMGTNATSSGVLTPINAYNFWTPENRNADYPNPFDYTRDRIMTPFRPEQTLFMEDGSFFKINGISLSYALDKRVLGLLGLGSASITASANNIHTFSKYSGVNPENVNSLGYDVSGGYPNSRSYTLGMNIRF